jgi:hypothetical protein
LGVVVFGQIDFRAITQMYFPRKNGHEKRLDWLTYLGLLDKQKITSFSCW